MNAAGQPDVLPASAASRSLIFAYCIAAACVGIALTGLVVMELQWSASTPVAVFLIAIVASAWLSGTRGAALALVLSLLCYVLFFLTAATPVPEGRHLIRLASLVVVAGYIVWLTQTNRAKTRSLQQASDELRLAIDTIPAMAWTLLPDGRVDFLNRRWLEYSGVTLADGLRDSMSTMHPDDRAGAMEKWRAHMAQGEPFESEMRLRRHDGEYRWFLVRTVPLLDANGKVVKWYGTSTDIDDRKRAEQAVEESRQLLQSMLETLPVGVAVMDSDGNIMLTNDAARRIWGRSIISGEQRWERSRGYWHDTGKRLAREDWASVQALHHGKSVQNQLVDIENFDDERKTIQNSAAPIRSAAGAVVRAVVVIEDVTDRMRAEKALRESADRLQYLSRRLFAVQEEERRHLARELHDEFGQLVTAISLHLRIAKGTAPSAAWPSLDECAALVERAGERVRGLALELRPTMLETAGLDGTLRWLAELHSRDSNFAVSVSGRVGPLANDLAITGFRVVQEALTNVLRHANARRVLINLEQDESHLRIAVEDDGVGFDLAQARGKAAAQGHLGLIGMKERVEILGGTLDITSTSGAGTKISVSLPMHAAV